MIQFYFLRKKIISSTICTKLVDSFQDICSLFVLVSFSLCFSARKSKNWTGWLKMNIPNICYEIKMWFFFFFFKTDQSEAFLATHFMCYYILKVLKCKKIYYYKSEFTGNYCLFLEMSQNKVDHCARVKNESWFSPMFVVIHLWQNPSNCHVNYKWHKIVFVDSGLGRAGRIFTSKNLWMCLKTLTPKMSWIKRQIISFLAPWIIWIPNVLLPIWS